MFVLIDVIYAFQNVFLRHTNLFNCAIKLLLYICNEIKQIEIFVPNIEFEI